jgi:hypothetical protein
LFAFDWLHRVRSQAAAALIDLCDGVQQAELADYLDPIVERLLEPLNLTEDDAKLSKRYVQEHVIAALAVVAKKSQGLFAKASENMHSNIVSNFVLIRKHYSIVMPSLFNILRNATGTDSRKLLAKAMECTGLISLSFVVSVMSYLHPYVAAAVGRDIFLPDAGKLAELLVQIQSIPCFPSFDFCS